MSITGGDFRSDNVLIRFGQDVVAGQVLSSSVVVVVSPARPTGEPRVRVVIDEDRATMNQELMFEYVNAARATSAHPTAGSV